MNPTVYKYYLNFCSTFLKTSDKISSLSAVQSAAAYSGYLSHLAKNYSPRLALFETYSDAYTPKRVKYNAYIVYGLVLSTLAFEFNRVAANRGPVKN